MKSRSQKSMEKHQGYVKGKGLTDTKNSSKRTKAKVDGGIKSVK